MLDRNKETGSVGEPVYLDVVTALNQAGRGDIRVVGGRYGLSSKDTTPGQIIAVYDNLKQETPKNNFTIGINDDVTYTSLDYKEMCIRDSINTAHWELLEEGRLTRDEVLVQRFEQLFRELGVDHSGKAISERYEMCIRDSM